MKGIANGFCLLVICSTLLIACSSPPPSLPRSYLLSPSAPQEAKEISRPVWLVADNQIHNLYGEPIPLLRTGLADRLCTARLLRRVSPEVVSGAEGERRTGSSGHSPRGRKRYFLYGRVREVPGDYAPGQGRMGHGAGKP